MRRSEWLLGFAASGIVLTLVAAGCSSGSSTTMLPSGQSMSGSAMSGSSMSGSSMSESDAASSGSIATGSTGSTSGATMPPEEAGPGDATAGNDCPMGTITLSDGGMGMFPGACVSCLQTKCQAELTACAADCACGPAESCLQKYDNASDMCPDARNAFFNNQPLINMQNCLVTMCPSCPANG